MCSGVPRKAASSALKASTKSWSSLRKPKAPWPLTDLPATSPKGVVELDPVGLRGHVGDRERGQRGGVGAAGLDGGDEARLVGQADDLGQADAGVVGVAGLDRAGHHRELEVTVVGEAREVLDALRVAGGHQHCLADAVGGLGEGDLLAARRVDEHAGGDDVEAAGLEARDQRAELGQDAVDLGDAHLGEHRLRHLRRLAGQLARGGREAERRLVGEADADVAVGLGLLQCRLREGRRGGEGEGDSGGRGEMPAGDLGHVHAVLPC